MYNACKREGSGLDYIWLWNSSQVAFYKPFECVIKQYNLSTALLSDNKLAIELSQQLQAFSSRNSCRKHSFQKEEAKCLLKMMRKVKKDADGKGMTTEHRVSHLLVIKQVLYLTLAFLLMKVCSIIAHLEQQYQHDSSSTLNNTSNNNTSNNSNLNNSNLNNSTLNNSNSSTLNNNNSSPTPNNSSSNLNHQSSLYQYTFLNWLEDAHSLYHYQPTNQNQHIPSQHSNILLYLYHAKFQDLLQEMRKQLQNQTQNTIKFKIIKIIQLLTRRLIINESQDQYEWQNQYELQDQDELQDGSEGKTKKALKTANKITNKPKTDFYDSVIGVLEGDKQSIAFLSFNKWTKYLQLYVNYNKDALSNGTNANNYEEICYEYLQGNHLQSYLKENHLQSYLKGNHLQSQNMNELYEQQCRYYYSQEQCYMLKLISQANYHETLQLSYNLMNQYYCNMCGYKYFELGLSDLYLKINNPSYFDNIMMQLLANAFEINWKCAVNIASLYQENMNQYQGGNLEVIETLLRQYVPIEIYTDQQELIDHIGKLADLAALGLIAYAVENICEMFTLYALKDSYITTNIICIYMFYLKVQLQIQQQHKRHQAQQHKHHRTQHIQPIEHINLTLRMKQLINQNIEFYQLEPQSMNQIQRIINSDQLQNDPRVKGIKNLFSIYLKLEEIKRSYNIVDSISKIIKLIKKSARSVEILKTLLHVFQRLSSCKFKPCRMQDEEDKIHGLMNAEDKNDGSMEAEDNKYGSMKAEDGTMNAEIKQDDLMNAASDLMNATSQYLQKFEGEERYYERNLKALEKLMYQ